MSTGRFASVAGSLSPFPPGDELIHLFVPEPLRELALAVHSSFVDRLLWSGKVVGVRVWLADANVAAVKCLVRAAWAHKAPKELVSDGSL